MKALNIELKSWQQKCRMVMKQVLYIECWQFFGPWYKGRANFAIGIN